MAVRVISVRGKVLLRGGVPVVLVLVKPALWLGAAIHVVGGTPAEVRAEAAPGAAEASSAPSGVTGDEVLPPQLAVPEASPASLEGLESLERVTHRSRPGDSIAKFLNRLGLSESESYSWVRAIERHYAAKRLPVGKDLHFYLGRSDAAVRGQGERESLKALEIDLDEDRVLTWEKGNEGIIFARREKPYEIERKTVGGMIDGKLFSDGVRAGLEPALLSQLVDIFSWDIDFRQEMQKGDRFRIVYEQRARKGSTRKPSLRILAAELVSAGEEHVAVYFEREKGNGGYYDLEGRALARAFLRFPLEFTSISSYFTHSRVHPVLKVGRPHHGVDFAARRGTPVRAIGDGRVVFAAWKKGGYGRMIELQHEVGYATRYAHLQGFAKGIRRGVSVKKGQVIGYVGSSGLTTGSHLHFELYKDEAYVDPLKFEFPRQDKIEPGLRRAFEDLKEVLLAQLAATPHS